MSSSSPSSAPAKVTVRQSVALVWRTLRSMRTALVLLLLIALAAVAGSLVPQAGISDARIAAMFRDHPFRAELYERIGLFDVYGSWWFTFLYTLLLVSLAACLLPRSRAMIRNLRAKPVAARELDGMRHYAERTVAGEPHGVILRSRRVLRRKLFRISRSNGDPSIAADKGLAREIGSLMFHWSFFLLLIGIVYGKGTGFTGQAVIVEGGTWTEAHANYDGVIREGSFFDENHSGVQIHVDSFTATYRSTGQPSDFVTHAELLDPQRNVVKTVDIRVNHPAEIDGVKVFQFGYGWAPVIEVDKDDKPIASGPVICQQGSPPAGVSPLQLPWDCIVKLPSLDPQVGIRFSLWPDSRGLLGLLQTGQAMPMFDVYQPVMTYTAYRGDLLSDVPQGLNQLDTTAMKQFSDGALGAGETVDLGGGLTVSFPDLKQYTVLQVARDSGLWIVLLAAILILVGLMPALYSSRRKVWVRAESNGTGTMLKVGGYALQRTSQFEEEFSKLVDELARASDERVGAP